MFGDSWWPNHPLHGTELMAIAEGNAKVVMIGGAATADGFGAAFLSNEFNGLGGAVAMSTVDGFTWVLNQK